MITEEEATRRETIAETQGWNRAVSEEIAKRYAPLTTGQVLALAKFYETATGLLASSIVEET